MMVWVNSAFFAVIFLFQGVAGGQYCDSTDYDWSTFRYKSTYCEYGCCFFSCCSVAVVVVPCVIGGIIIIAVIIAVICCCSPRCCQKKGVVVSPGFQGNLPYNQQIAMYPRNNHVSNPGSQPVPTLLHTPMQPNNFQAYYPGPQVYQYPGSNQQHFQPMPQPDYNARASQLQPPTYSTPTAPPPPYPY